MDVFVLFCSASFRDENFTSARIFQEGSLARVNELEILASVTRMFL